MLSYYLKGVETMHNKCININDLEELKKDIISNKINLNNYLKAFKIAVILKDNSIFELLKNIIPNDITNDNEEKFYETQANIRFSLN